MVYYVFMFFMIHFLDEDDFPVDILVMLLADNVGCADIFLIMYIASINVITPKTNVAIRAHA